MEASTPALTPKLRFPEFRGAEGWERTTLRQATVPVTERVGKQKLTPVSISAGIGFVPQAEKFGRDISGNQYQLYTVVSDGDFVYNKGNSLKFPQGCVYLLQGWGKVAAPNVFICFRLKEGFSSVFFQNCFEQNMHGIQLKRHITSGARSNGLLNISKENFFGIEIPTPSLAEQQKIAECLSSVDELIAAQARKVETLKSHKKGLMQQLFPHAGETQPRLRFPEFRGAGEWEIDSFDKLIEVIDGDRGLYYPKAQEFAQSGFCLFLSAKNVTKSGFKFEETQFISKEKDEVLRNGKLKRADVVLTTRGTVGQFAYYSDDIPYENIRINSGMAILRAKSKKIIPNYLYCFTKSESLKLYIKNTAFGNAQLQLTVGEIKKFKLNYPEPDEQQHIAGCLHALDDLIAAESQKLAALKTHKKGLMQQLFPSPEEVEP